MVEIKDWNGLVRGQTGEDSMVDLFKTKEMADEHGIVIDRSKYHRAKMAGMTPATIISNLMTGERKPKQKPQP